MSGEQCYRELSERYHHGLENSKASPPIPVKFVEAAAF